MDMVGKNKSYKILNPKRCESSKGTFYRFSVSDASFNKDTKEMVYNGFIQMTTFTERELVDREQIKIKEIIGASNNRYTDKNGQERETTILLVELQEQEEDFTNTYDNTILPF